MPYGVSLANIVSVAVSISNPSIIASNFNMGLIIGDSDTLTALNRVKIYDRTSYQANMVSDGFATTDPEYLAAVAYFGQNPAPSKVAIGVKLSTETSLQAINASRVFSDAWYSVCFAYETTDADIPAIAAAVEAYSNPTVFFYQSDDPNCLVASSSNVMATLKASKYNRSIGFYSSTTRFICGLMGVFCGLNTMEANSSYTMAYKGVAGFTAEVITDAQLTALTSYNGNAYALFGTSYSFTFSGVAASGLHIDEVYMLDLTKLLIQQNVVSGLTGSRSIPQTESGINDIITFISAACDKIASIGFISTGIWTGETIKNLNYGDAISGGYLIQADSIASQSAADRAARKTPPIYVALKGSGSIEHVVISVYVNQ